MTGQQQEGRWRNRGTSVYGPAASVRSWECATEADARRCVRLLNALDDHGHADVAEALRDDLRLIMDQRDVTMEVNQVLIAENARLRESMKYLARLGDDHVKQYVEDALDAAPENKRGLSA